MSINVFSGYTSMTFHILNQATFFFPQGLNSVLRVLNDISTLDRYLYFFFIREITSFFDEIQYHIQTKKKNIWFVFLNSMFSFHNQQNKQMDSLNSVHVSVEKRHDKNVERIL